MAEKSPPADKFSDGTGVLRGVDLFSKGEKRGKDWTKEHLDEMVSNFNRFNTGTKPGFPVPLVLGHEEKDLDKTDIPAAAWLDRLWHNGTKLKGDFSGVHPKAKPLFDNKQYRTISVEIADNPKVLGLEGDGKMLRRVAALGGAIPQDKNLDDLPAVTMNADQPPAYSINFIKQTRTKDSYLCFSEVVSMNREALLQKLQEFGMDTATVTEAVPDSFLAECLRMADTDDGDDDDTSKFADSDAYDDEPPDGLEGDEMQQYAALCKKMMMYADRGLKKYPFGEATKVDATTTVAKTEEKGKNMDKMSEESLKAIVEAATPGIVAAIKADLEAKLKPVTDRVDNFNERVADFEKNTRRAGIEKFCETMVSQGKLLPKQLDRNSPMNVFDRLMRADASAKVHKFSADGKELALTELEMQMKEIETGPVLIKFGEKVKGVTAVEGDADAEVTKVEQHYETFADVSFKRMGVSKETLVSGYKAARKHNEGLTADEFLNP